MPISLKSAGLFLALSFLLSPVANARVFRLSSVGQVTRIIATESGFKTFSTTGLKIGDRVTFSALINTTTAKNRPWFDADPTINVYDHALQSVSITLNNYRYDGAPDERSAGVQIWDGYSYPPTDAFALFSNDFTQLASVGPFGVGTGQIAQTFSFNFFDSTGQLTSSDQLKKLVDLAFSTYSPFHLSFGDRSGNAGRSLLIDGEIVQANLTAVPETSMWSMMAVGFGLVGFAIRSSVNRRSHRVII